MGTRDDEANCVRCGILVTGKKVSLWLIPRDALEAYKPALAGRGKNDPTRGHEVARP